MGMDITAPDGTKRGDRVPNSQYFRAFCATCKEPIRVSQDRLNAPVRCDSCDPCPPAAAGPPRAALADRQYNGFPVDSLWSDVDPELVE